MAFYSKESLETLRHRIDLAEVLSTHLDLKRTGASYKGLCPFHDEKTPSFVIQKGDTHYHCFGCGAHGDAIQFLMTHLKMNFVDAVESLAQRFNVPLQQVEGNEEKKGPNKAALKEALELAATFFQMILLHTAEGHAALRYLYQRGIDLDFITRFRIGLAPRDQGMLRKVLDAKHIKDDVSAEAGLLSSGRDGGWREFFQDRITFPICDSAGAVIGFSARKYKEETFGGKYINTAETPLFKKSRILFGLHHSRRRIAKERRAIIVEGQIDALRLISEGFNITVASQGTAFGEGHVKEFLTLGINEVFLALDSDEAGRQAACKIGDFFQCEGVEVRIIELPPGADPDSFLRENGPAAFLEKMQTSTDYLSYLVKALSLKINTASPAGKNELMQILIKQVRRWNHPLMVHESLRKIAHLLQVPETIIGVGQEHMPNVYVKKSASIGLQAIDPDRIWEVELLRLLLMHGSGLPELFKIAELNLQPSDLRHSVCRKIFKLCTEFNQVQKPCDLLTLAIELEDHEAQAILSELSSKKPPREKVKEAFLELVQKILTRNWTEMCDEIRVRIQDPQHSEDTMLTKKYAECSRRPPKIRVS